MNILKLPFLVSIIISGLIFSSSSAYSMSSAALVLGNARKPEPARHAPSKYRFDPIELNEIRAVATAQVLEELAAKSMDQLNAEAFAYFPSRDRIASESRHPNDRLGGDFSEEDLSNMRKAYQTERVLSAVHQALKAKYPEDIVDKPIWVWNNVGNVYARIAVIACSLTEYIALWGTNIPQNGFSGVYGSMDVYDIMVTGKMWSNDARSNASNILAYEPGERVSCLNKDESRYYALSEYSYMIDYGRGSIVNSLWQGVFAPYLFSNHDWESFSTQLGVCAKQIL